MKQLGLLLAVITILLCGANMAVAAYNSGDVFKVIASEELKAMIDRKEPGLVIIDTRSPQEFQETHIKDAISMPWASLERDTSILNFPKESKLLFYCNGLA